MSITTAKTAMRDYVAKLLQHPRRNELLKPAVMLVVNIAVVIVVVEILTNSIAASDLSKIESYTWVSTINGFAFMTVMPAVMSLIGTTSDPNTFPFKNIGTVASIMLFVTTVAVFFFITSAIGSVSLAPVVIGATISMATMLAMTVVERRLLSAAK